MNERQRKAIAAFFALIMVSSMVAYAATIL
jgi:hypothetical protein